MDNLDILHECGYTKPVMNLNVKDKLDIVHVIGLHSVILKCLAEMDQFRDGLEVLSVASSLKEHPAILEEFFVMNKNSTLTAGLWRT